VKHNGKETDVPAGDVGVGEREIGYLFGHYMRIVNEFTGAITGKGIPFGGSQMRREATGYGCVYFMESMLNRAGDDLKGKTCLVSGSGNVAQFTVQKLIECGAKVLTMSDSNGFIHSKTGITSEQLEAIMEHKNVQRGRLHECAEGCGCDYYPGEKPWRVPAQIAFPSATQNEISGADARMMLDNGLIAVGEGANMPTELEGVHAFLDAKILYAPSKAANAGGVTVSGLEQTQNAQRYSWTREEVDAKLRDIMKKIHAQCVQYGDEGDWVDYVKGANLGGFVRIADAMLAYGVV
ncbi:MAG: glutamate dehydrogenase, partial [Candidatus Hydrogenedentes bacterium]|nr:glutamate dehydrogenase [Candidatus Hydrogenedentota bacterium]